jgi:hypothetical protein
VAGDKLLDLFDEWLRVAGPEEVVRSRQLHQLRPRNLGSDVATPFDLDVLVVMAI